MFTTHLELKKITNISIWRRIALFCWKAPNDPHTYTLLKFDCTKLLSYIENYRSKSSEKLTITHFFGKAVALTFAQLPEINRIERLGNLYQRNSIDIFYQVAMDTSGKDLSGITIEKCDSKSLSEIIEELDLGASNLRSGSDDSFNKIKSTFSLIPSFIISPVLKLTDFILYTCNLWSLSLGIKKNSFGSAMVTNVSQFGVEYGFVPLVPISHVPIIFALFKCRDEAVVVNGEIKIRPIMNVTVTFDHRIIDGVYGGKIVHSLKKLVENPTLIK